MNIPPEFWAALEKFGPAIVFTAILSIIIVPTMLFLAIRALSQSSKAQELAGKARDDMTRIAGENTDERKKIQEEKDKLAAMTVRQNDQLRDLSISLQKNEDSRLEDSRTYKRELEQITKTVERLQQEYNTLKDKLKVVSDESSAKDIVVTQKIAIIGEQAALITQRDDRIGELEREKVRLEKELADEKSNGEIMRKQLREVKLELEALIIERDSLKSQLSS